MPAEAGREALDPVLLVFPVGGLRDPVRVQEEGRTRLQQELPRHIGSYNFV